MLRGGPFSEKRVIELINRRFVPFFFNVGKRGRGYDPEAAAFIAKVDPRFGGNAVPTPPVWVFGPDGTLLATISNYAPKAQFYDALRQVLRDHPALDADTKDETAAFEAAGDKAFDGPAELRAGRLAESLGRWKRAQQWYGMVAANGAPAQAAAAHLGLARLARYEQRWDGVAKALQALSTLPEAVTTPVAADVAAERGHRLLAGKKHAEAYTTFVEAARAHPTAKRLGELHFYAGVAAFHLAHRDWADFHWCWVMKNLPDDHLYMRCYLAATVDAMPYPNPELGGYRGKNRMISHRIADAARDKAVATYEALLPAWREGRSALDAAPKPAAKQPGKGGAPAEDF